MKSQLSIIALIGTLAFGAGCGSSGNNSTGTAGTTGTGGSGGPEACVAPTAALITDFGSGTYPVGAPYSGGDPNGTVAPTVTTTTGSLVITLATGPSTNAYPYAYVGLPFIASCVDAHTYTGVKFIIGGTLNAGCSIQFSTEDKEHTPTTLPGVPGTCTVANCYPSSKQIIPLPATPTDVTILFADQTGGGAAPTAAIVDPTQILSVVWQVNPPAATGCTGTVTIDNVTFI